MKYFNNLELTKNDKIVIKNFNIDSEYTEINMNYVENENLKNILNNLRNVKLYHKKINSKNIFFITYFELEFFYIETLELKDQNLIKFEYTNSKESVKIFKSLMGICIKSIKYDIFNGYKIELPGKYLKLYHQLFFKVLKNNNIGTRAFKLKKQRKKYYIHYYDRIWLHNPLLIKEKLLKFQLKETIFGELLKYQFV